MSQALEAEATYKLLGRFKFGLPTLEQAVNQPDLTLELIRQFNQSLPGKPTYGVNERDWKYSTTDKDRLVSELQSKGGVLIAESIPLPPGGTGGGHSHIPHREIQSFYLETLSLRHERMMPWLLFRKLSSTVGSGQGAHEERLNLREIQYFLKLGFPIDTNEIEMIGGHIQHQSEKDKLVASMGPITAVNPAGQAVNLTDGELWETPGVMLKGGNGTKIFLGEFAGESAHKFVSV